jgi:hypothetical protein
MRTGPMELTVTVILSRTFNRWAAPVVHPVTCT